MRRALALLAAALLWAGTAVAQPVSLVADQVRIESDSILVAEGNVEIFYEDSRLEAAKVTYNRDTGALSIVGPIRLAQGPNAEVVLLGDAAELEEGLRDGIVTSARIVLKEQLQIAADELAAMDGRYRQLTNAVASGCRVCREGQTPLWEIRAARILHDTQTRQLYFSRAQFRVAGIPVFYLPRLRLPDPTLDRARGFLAPQWKSSSELSRGPLVPYFIPFGDSADLTVSPWVTSRTTTVELRYRQMLRQGEIELSGALSRDELLPGELRGYVLADARFALPRGFRLDVEIEAASDDLYADQYEYNTSSRLESFAAISRTRPNELIDLAFFNYDIVRPGSLRPIDRNLVNLGEANYIRVFPTRFGRLMLGVDADAYYRDSKEDVLGRDVTRLGAGINWWNGAVLPLGLALDATAELRADAYAIRRDPTYEPDQMRLTPAAAIGLRWPLVRSGGGVAETIEPVAQLVWSDVSGEDVPNEDSRVAELDEGNLFALDRFPGSDRSETGARLNLGTSYVRSSQDWRFSGYVGRILRFGDEEQFSEPTGLNGTWSDWLVSGQVGVGDWVTVTNRAVFDDAFDFARNEFRLGFDAGPLDFSTAYLWIIADPAVDRRRDINEAIFDADYEFSRNWFGGVEGRWDLIAERVNRTDFDLSYRNECVVVDLYLSRRFLTSSDVEPDYSFGVEVSLRGFGTSDSRRYTRSCSG